MITMDELHIERRTVELDDVYVKRNGHIAKVDDVLNTLTILLYSDKDHIPITDPEVVAYLKAYKLIKSVGPGCYTVTDRERCSAISDTLSDYMDNLLENY